MKENFHHAMVHVFEHEGGYSNDPDDPGGETNYGISKRYHPNVDIKNLTKEDAQTIYLTEYWLPNGCDDLPFPLDVIHFDSCINPGAKASGIFLYMARGQSDPSWQSVTYLDLRIRYYLRKIRENPVKLKYIQGWMDRCLDLLEEAVLTKELMKERGT
jgi:hypothetical protein